MELGGARGRDASYGMTEIEIIERELSYAVVGAFFEVYNTLGYGFLEQLYVEALTIELRERGHQVEREVPIAVRYKGRVIGKHRMDMVVDRRLVVEAKSSQQAQSPAQRSVRRKGAA